MHDKTVDRTTDGGGAVAEKLPADSTCTLTFTGGNEVSFDGARSGMSYTCELSNTQAACTPS